MIDPIAMGAGFLAYHILKALIDAPKRRRVRRRLEPASVRARSVTWASPGAPQGPTFAPMRFGSRARRDFRQAA